MYPIRYSCEFNAVIAAMVVAAFSVLWICITVMN